MRRNRLVWLVVAMAVLALLRVVVPFDQGDQAPPSVAEAIIRRPVGAPAPTMPSKGMAVAVDAPLQQEGIDDEGNAFAVRRPPAVAQPEAVAVVAAVPRPRARSPVESSAVIEPSPLPAPMPFEVIGTWDDGKAPGVFLSSAAGAVLARPGMTLQAEYQVTAVTPTQISLMHITTHAHLQLAVVRPPETPRPIP